MKLSHSCLAEPYRASVDVFPAEWDNLPVLSGAKRRWLGPSDTRSPFVEFGEWRCPLAGTDPGGQVSSPSCVYLLAPCGENLPINCMLILSVYDSIILVVLHRRRIMNLTFPLITVTSFSLWLFPSPLLLWSYLLPYIKTLNSFMHVLNHIWGFWHVAALNRAPVTKTLPAVLGIHLLFHTRADLRAQQLQACNSLGCRGLRSRRQVGERRK